MRILFVAGDPSGDQHAARVAGEIKSIRPDAEVLAIGGPALRQTADRFFYDLVSMSVVGFWEPVKKLPAFLSVYRNVLQPAMNRERPDVVVPVDFFGFNRLTAHEAKKRGLKVFYYISPQVWASRPGRVDILRRSVDKMLVIFPFEESFYSERGVPAVFVGHPALDSLPDASGEAPRRMEPVVGLLPGSRPGEVKRHLPLFIETARLLSARIPGIRFVLFAAPSLSNEYYDRVLAENGAREGFPYLMELVRDENFEWRASLDLALTCSGSATLENALLGVPMVVVYKMSWVTYALARRLANVSHIAMANILAGEALVPELIQDQARPEALAEESVKILKDLDGRRDLRQRLLALRLKLGGPGASRRAAEEILKGL